MASINRIISKSVATQNEISVREKKVRPNKKVDTLCVFTDEMREDVLNLYRKQAKYSKDQTKRRTEELS